MSYGHQPPPPKTTGAGTIIGVLALVFIGIPALLCLIGGVAIWGIAGFPGAKLVGKEVAWRKVVAEKQRLEQDLIAELRTIAAANNNTIPVSAVHRISSRGLEIDAKINELANQTHREYGEPSQAVKDELKSTAELQKFVSTLNMPNSPFSSLRSPSMPSGPMPDPFAQQRAESEQRMAALRADQQQRDAQRETERQQRVQQLESLRIAEQQAREQRMREFANIPRPQPFIPPPVFNNPPPAFNNPPAAPQPQANEPPPGFPANDVSQVKPRDIVYVQVGDKWFPALVQLKRGKVITVRSDNGESVQVTIDRIRLQNEPTTVVAVAPAASVGASNLPPALRAATPPKKSSEGTPEEEDDSLFIAKPGSPSSQSPSTPAPSNQTPSDPFPLAKKPAAGPEYRTWTNETGEFKVEAELVNFEFDLVTLKRRDGKILSLRIEKLSADDQAIIRQKFP